MYNLVGQAGLLRLDDERLLVYSHGVHRCQEQRWILLFRLCDMDLLLALLPRRPLAVFLSVAIDAIVPAAPFLPRSPLGRELDDRLLLVAASASFLLPGSSILLLAKAR